MKFSPQNPGFISQSDLETHVKRVVDVAKKTIETSDKKFYNNSVDPFSALFDSILQGLSITQWIEQEKLRQNQKTIQNALGEFHQKVLSSIKGWNDLKVGEVVDIKNDKKKIIAEVKNKHNTTKGNHKVAIYDDLKGELNKKYKGYTAYYVEVIPKNKKTYNKPFTPPDNRTKKTRPVNERIRVIDGKSFYALATGDENALEKLYTALPAAIIKAVGKKKGAKFDKDFRNLFDKVY